MSVLRDLEAAVEDLRSDVLNKRCRVQTGEVESMALALSSVSKALADLKGEGRADAQRALRTVFLLVNLT